MEAQLSPPSPNSGEWTLTLMFFVYHNIHVVNTRLDVIPCQELRSLTLHLSLKLEQLVNVPV